MNSVEIQTIISAITVIGSGLSVYVGVRSALAEMKSRLDGQEVRLDDHDDRIKWLERLPRKTP